MILNLPILDSLNSCKNILITGIGGGFDIYAGLPIYFELRRRGMSVHLANYSFSSIAQIKDGLNLSPSLHAITAQDTLSGMLAYFPEGHLSRWFYDRLGLEVTIWGFEKTGVALLYDAYEALVKYHQIDGIIMVDGGFDSLLRGDEAQLGTIVEDSISLCAINALPHIQTKILACIALGAELDITYAHVFENIAVLTDLDAFYGTCSLVRAMESYQLFEDAVLYAQVQVGQDSSVINSSIVSATQGHFGNFHLTEKTRGNRLWISPLMPMYWFFDGRTVAKRNLFLPDMGYTDSVWDVVRLIQNRREHISARKDSRVPL
jgi:hypothetical protein